MTPERRKAIEQYLALARRKPYESHPLGNYADDVGCLLEHIDSLEEAITIISSLKALIDRLEHDTKSLESKLSNVGAKADRIESGIAVVSTRQREIDDTITALLLTGEDEQEREGDEW